MSKVVLPARQIEIAYDDQGAGEPIVFLHAFPFDREMWRAQVDDLSTDYRVIAPDFPGFGESSPATEAFTVESLADITADFLDGIGITGTVTIVGLSMGGYVALAFARRQPHRLRCLVLVDTKAEADDDAAKAARDRTMALARESGLAGVIEASLPKLISDETRLNRPAIVEQIKRIALRQPVPTVVQALMALRERPDATPGLGQITVPTLVLVGEQDIITPPSVANALAERILGAVQVIILGVGHLSNLEEPREFNQQLRRFLHLPKQHG